MMFILTQEELDDLRKQQGDGLAMKVEQRQKICSKVANEMPVDWGWGGPDPKPWGCMLTTEYEWYCDMCPVSELCPAEKSWSK